MAYPDKDRYIPNKGTAGHSNWQEGDYVTAANMNHIEDGIDQAVQDAETYTDGALDTVKTLSGSTNPTTATAGTVGQKYLNTNTKDIYVCTSVTGGYTWIRQYKWDSTQSKYVLLDANGDEIEISSLLQDIDQKADATTLAEEYDSQKIYTSGDLLIYESLLYECIANAPVGTLPTNTTYFKEVSVDDVIKEIEDGNREVATAKQAEAIKSNRVIDDADVSCPPITFGTTGGDAEIQSGFNKFKFLFGKSKKWNQLVDRAGISVTGVSRTYSNGKLTLNGTVSTSNTYYYDFTPASYTFIEGHKYLFLNFYSIFGKSLAVQMNRSPWSGILSGTINGDSVIKTCTITTDNAVFYCSLTSGVVINSITYPQIFDLTAIYGAGNEPTASSEFRKEYPLAYYAYNESTILSAKSSELVSVGENQWDEEWEVGIYNVENGAKVASTTRIRTKNKIPVIPGTVYYKTTPNTGFCYILCYDKSGAFIKTISPGLGNQQFTVPDNCYYITSYTENNAYGTTYNHDISIYICWDTPGRPYVANRTDRVTLPNIELRSVTKLDGTEVRDEAYQEGGGKRYVGRATNITLNNNDGVHYSNVWYYVFAKPSDYIKYNQYESSTDLKNYTMINKYSKDAPSTANDAGAIGCIRGDIMAATFCVGFAPNTTLEQARASFSGFELNYVLATPTDIPTSENPGWTELVYTDNYGTLQFLTDPAQIPQVPQPYYIEYTVSLVDFLDATYAHADGDATKLALKQSVDDIVNGNTPAGKALLADNLESNNKIEDLLPYTMRQAPSGVGKSMLLDHFTGATVAFNQLAKSLAQGDWQSTSSTASYNNGVATFTVNSQYGNIHLNNSTDNIISGHKYLMTATVKLTSAVSGIYVDISSGNSLQIRLSFAATTNTQTVCRMLNADATGLLSIRVTDSRSSGWDAIQAKNIMVIDLTQMFGSTIANYLYNLGETAGVDKFRNLFPKPYYPYNAGELVGIKTAGRKAIGINIWDQQWEVGTIDPANGQNSATSSYFRSTNYIPCLPSTNYYFKTANNVNIFRFYYDASKNYLGYTSGNGNTSSSTLENCWFMRFVNVSASTYNNDICINISDASINGTFYPYEADEYPCEEVELNGEFTLDSNNNIVAVNGDTYANDGKIIRIRDSVDLGGLNWSYISSGNGYWQASYSGGQKGFNGANVPTGLCTKYALGSYNNNILGNVANYIFYNSTSIYVNNGSNATTPSGTLQYELATPTEETASSFASTQKTGVTEQFMEPELAMTVFLPVGHDSFYLPDLKEKLEVAPDSPTSDGTYLVSRSGGTNVYIPIANVTATQAEIDEIIAILE